jgi:hypothetical protein
MTQLKKLALVIGVSALANLALPQRSTAISCSSGPCYQHVYEFCCAPPLRCKNLPC